MGRLTRLLCPLLAILAASCSAAAVSTALPRPSISTSSTATPPPSSTTTLDPAIVLSTECPTSFCLVYRISARARWSTGEPVTAEDFAHTLDVVRDDGSDIAAYRLVSRIDVIDEKSFRLVADAPFGGWQDLFLRLIPRGSDGNDVRTMPSTGPFQLVEWVEGDHIVVRRSPQWWAETDPLSGDPPGTVDQITFVFIADPVETASALGDGTVDVVSSRPDVATIEDLTALDEVDYALTPGPFWEHIDFHHEDTLLGERWLRRAISLAIDREGLLDRTVRLVDPDAAGLGNTVWMAPSPSYEPHYLDEFDPAAAESILVDNSCERGDDEVYVCSGRRLSFTWASTSDDPMRQEIYTSVSEDLSEVGIELTEELRTPSTFVNRDFLFGGPDVWQLINFSWRAPFDPGDSIARYICDDIDLNVNRYCSEEVEALARSAGEIADPAERARVLNEVDRMYLDDYALIPLFQKPNLLAWRSGIVGPEPNASVSTDLWNVAAWRGAESIVVAIPSEPTLLDPLSFSDDAANVILSTLMYGAFGMTPSLQTVPALVDSVTILEG